MLRLQQEEIKPAMDDETDRGYRPPWTDKRFFLLDGSGRRVVIVDENCEPEFYEEFAGLHLKYLEPTAALLHQIKDENVRRNVPFQIVLDERFSYVPKEQPDKNDRYSYMTSWDKPKADPRIINRIWEDKVRNIFFNPFETYYPLLERDEENVKEEESKLLNLPQEVYEVMISNLDGLSFTYLCQVVSQRGDEELLSTLWGALKVAYRRGNCDFWKRSVLHVLPHDRSALLVTSFYNVMYKQQRMTGENFEPFYDAITSYDCVDVVMAEVELREKFLHGKLVVKNMNNFVDEVKADCQLNLRGLLGNELDANVSDAPTKETLMRRKRTRVLFGVTGNFAYYVVTPYSFDGHGSSKLVLLEDLDKCLMRRQTVGICTGFSTLERDVPEATSDAKIRFTKIMHFPLHSAQEEHVKKTDNSLPEFDRLLFIVCRYCTRVKVMDSGARGFIVLHNKLDYTEGNFDGMDPILAINGDVFAIWPHPIPLEIYKVVKRPEGYDKHLLQRLHIVQGPDYWNLLCNYTQYFIPELIRVKNEGVNALPKKKYSTKFLIDNEALDKEYYELKFINMRWGTDCISIRDLASSDDPTVKKMGKYGQLWAIIQHQRPQYYYHNALEVRSLLDRVFSGCYGHGLYIFWNHKALACSWGDGLNWMFHSWAKAVAPLAKKFPGLFDEDESQDFKVTQMAVCSSTVVAAVFNKNFVVLFDVKKTPGKLYRDKVGLDGETWNHEVRETEPKFIMTPIRVINLEEEAERERTPRFLVDTMTFGMEYGNPYLFFLMKPQKPTSFLDYSALRVTFQLQEEDKDCSKSSRSVDQDSDEIPPEVIQQSLESYMQEQEHHQQSSNSRNPDRESIAQMIFACKRLDIMKRTGNSGKTNYYMELDSSRAGEIAKGYGQSQVNKLVGGLADVVLEVMRNEIKEDW